MTSEAFYPQEFLLMMITKDGRILHSKSSKLESASMYGELLLEEKQILAFDIFQIQPTRKFLPRQR